MLVEQVLAGLEYYTSDLIPNIKGISYDSRQTKPGDLFVAISGFQLDGHHYVKEAQKKGACAALVEKPLQNCDLPQIVVKDTRVALGLVSANFYGHPAQQLKILGITGTNGKTSCTYLVKSILEAAGYRVGLIGTIEILLGKEVWPASRTTPESLDLQRILAKMVKEKVDFVVMEVSSHALDLNRTVGLSFVGALFTNLSSEHLDFHQTMEAYFEAKLKLFKDQTEIIVSNLDDSWGEKLIKKSPGIHYTYGVKNQADFQAENIHLASSGVSYILKSGEEQVPIQLQLTGHFNVYNSLGAAALCFSQGLSLAQIKSGLEKVAGVPGRFEQVKNSSGLNVIVDYAHTPDGLENILRSAREITSNGQIILVFGAGGDRDKSKRPLMGAIAAQLADQIIITSDNPRSEDPKEICSNIEQGVLTANSATRYEIIVDRWAAIYKAVELCGPNDTVIIAGKGHEEYQEFEDERIYFADGDVVREAIKELKV